MKGIVRVLFIGLFAVTMGFAAETNLTLTVDGITYNNVRFVHPTPATVTIYHSTGVATIPLSKLPPDLQKQFNYDPQAATQWELTQQKIDAATAEAQRQQAARWKAAQEKAAAEAAEAEETQRKAAAAVQWTLRVQSVLPDGVIAWGRPSASPNGSVPVTILLMDPPRLHELAEGDEITASAYRDGNAVAQTRTLEKWVCVPSAPPSVAEVSPRQTPPAASAGSDIYIPDLPNTGAFGFPQARAMVLCTRPALRFSVFSNNKYLFAQAVIWGDTDPSPDRNDDGSEGYHRSLLILDLDGDGMATPNVDRMYAMNTSPTWPGPTYQVYLGPDRCTGMQNSPAGRGAIRYVRIADGKRVRVDSYLIPLEELSKRVGDKIRIYYYAYSPRPPLSLNSVNFNPGFRFFEKGQPYLLANGHEIDPTQVPDGRDDKPATQQ